MSKTVLVRYGAISEVARFVNGSGIPLNRGAQVVVQSHRGLESGLLLEDAPAGSGRPEETDEADAGTPTIVRPVTDDDCAQAGCTDRIAKNNIRAGKPAYENGICGSN